MKTESGVVASFCKAFIFSVAMLALCAAPARALDAKQYRILIAFDTVLPFSEGIIEGFKATMDARLALSGASAVYQVYDTKLDPATVPAILDAIYGTEPDLVCTVNYPTAFADSMITKKLAGTGFRIVSSNPIPVQTGIIRDWQRPGGNVTGVGVFLKFNPQIKLMKMINPAVNKMAFVSWDVVGPLNEWFELELRRACREEGIDLVEFRRVSSVEQEMAFYKEYDKKSLEYFIMAGISSFVHEDGSPADTVRVYSGVVPTLKRLQQLAYEENPIRMGAIAGACVVWYDIGAQLAEKGLKILDGANPGDLPWDYPRKYSIMLNLKAAKDRGISFPQGVIGAAYRAYTDYEGNFIGKKN